MKKNKKQEVPEERDSSNSSPETPRENQLQQSVRRHLRFGWWCLFAFLSLGMVLEGLQAFKVDAYLSVSNSTRRLMWTLAHAHGTLLGLINLGFAFTLPHLPQWKEKQRKMASNLLVGATFLMPAGFFLGGVIIHDGDPSLGILLLPIGGLMLFAAAFMASSALRKK